MENEDIRRAARALVRHYGDDAGFVAELWARWFASEGNGRSAAIWHRIALVSEELSGSTRPGGFCH
jgi:hypothetical protein